jgi:hypothetical protein
MKFAEMRRQTLLNFQAFSVRIQSSKELSKFTIRKAGEITIPFLYKFNRPISNAIWHDGQVSSFRRSCGNPINSKANHFSGTVKE